MKTLCLLMIVRNESKVIERSLNSVKNIIDSYVIVDTGSTDNTIESIKKTLHNIPGQIYHSKWQNFAINRTQALQFAKNTSDYAILLDADEVVILDNFDKEKLIADAYYIHYTGDLDYAQILLINNRINWSYKSVTHEYIHSTEAKTYEEMNELKMTHFYDGGCRVDKFQRDIELLRQGIIDEPANSRYHFYLGQSHKDLDKYEEAIEYYLKTIELSSWVEEIFYSKYMIGRCYELLKKYNEAKVYYLSAWEYRPTRAESLYRLVLLCRDNREYQQAYLFAQKALEIPYSKDHLFVERPVYDYLILFEKSISAYYINKFEESYNACKKLMNIRNISDSIKNQNRINITFSEQKLFGRVITSQFDKESAIKALTDVSEIFNTIEELFFLQGGTLLGFQREGDFLSHDDDIDIGVIGDEKCEIIKEEFLKREFTFSLQIGSKKKDLEYRFYKYGIQVDIFFNYYLNNNQIYCGVFDNNGNSYRFVSSIFDISQTLFQGIKVGIPSDPIKYLKEQYGKDWKKENKTWHYLDAKNKEIKIT